MLLKEKVVLITGSSTGIGRAAAELCLNEGASVMIHGLDEAETKGTAEALNQPYLSSDLSHADAAETLIQHTLAHYGKLDGLVNNAASVARSDLESVDVAFFDRMIALNVRAPLLLIKAAMPGMQNREGAAIVNIGSVNAHCGHPNLLPYSISKAGLMTMTRNLANAYAKDAVRVNQLNPGWIKSENEIALQISEGQSPDWYNNLPEETAPLGRLLEPAEVAKHIVYWLSDASAPVTGAVYEVEQFPFVGRP